MSDTNKELSHLEKLEARMAKLRMQIAKEKKKESAKVRKERTHRLIKKGGLVEMVWGDSVDAGLLGLAMYRNGNQFFGGDGIVKKGVENTIDSVGRLARVGMEQTDKEIIKLMLET